MPSRSSLALWHRDQCCTWKHESCNSPYMRIIMENSQLNTSRKPRLSFWTVGISWLWRDACKARATTCEDKTKYLQRQFQIIFKESCPYDLLAQMILISCLASKCTYACFVLSFKAFALFDIIWKWEILLEMETICSYGLNEVQSLGLGVVLELT